jgi:hypothetical protein
MGIQVDIFKEIQFIFRARDCSAKPRKWNHGWQGHYGVTHGNAPKIAKSFAFVVSSELIPALLTIL